MASYTKLNPALKEIRLLRVLPETHHDGDGTTSFINCELSIHKLDKFNPPSYNALSYVWGPGPPVKTRDDNNTLLLDGQPIPARENLLNALRSFQKRGDEGHIWADAVCINQSDMDEKETQIALMGNIYSLAERTIIWLGPEEGDSGLGMSFVDRVIADDFELNRFESNTHCLKAVMGLLQRSWWSRLWIMQEAFLSKLPIARCGDKDIPFERFVILKKLHDASYKKSPSIWRNYMLFQNVRFASCLSNWAFTKNELATNGGSTPFSWMSTMSSRLLSTVPQDKIYGTLGMCTPKERAAIRINLDLPVSKIIIDVVVRSLDTEGLMFLSYVLPKDMKTMELPSWVPDLAALDLTQNLLACGYKANLNPDDPAWTALAKNSTLTAHDSPLVASPKRDIGLLILYGCLCDVVSYADPMPVVPQYDGFDAGVVEQTKAKRWKTSLETLKKWEPLALETRYDTPDAYKAFPGGRKDAFWRTVACDGGVKGALRPLPADFGERYETLLSRQPPTNSDMVVDDPTANEWVREYGVPVVAKSVNHSFFLTQCGRMGMAMRGVKAGDIVIIARGGSVPYVVRKHQDWGFTFVGEAYLHGVMDGEGVIDAVRQGRNLMKFYLR